jgi:4-hydroxy-2-oxoglutarate aldolase
MAKAVSMAGIFPPIPTPFDAQEELDLKSLAKNIAHWNTTPISGYVVLGSNGEMTYLTEAEKLQVFETARKAIAPGKLMMAGCGCESTHASIQLTKQAAAIGADVALFISPCYYKSKMDNAALTDYYTRLADASPIPVSVYNFPANTGLDLSAELVIKLAQHPNIAAVKESGGNVVKMGEIIKNTRPDFQVLAGSAGFLYPSLVLGAVGGVLALANIVPQQCCDILNFAKAGKHEEARQLQLRMIAPNTAVTAGMGVAGLKAAMDMLGLAGGKPRSPMQPLGDEQKGKLKKILQEAGILS